MRQPRTNEATRYELIATDGTRKILVGYMSRKSRREVILFLTVEMREILPEARIHALARSTGTEAADWVTGERNEQVFARNGSWVVKFSGRTQREVVTTGELPESIYV